MNCENCGDDLHKRIVTLTDQRFPYRGDRDGEHTVRSSVFCSIDCLVAALTEAAATELGQQAWGDAAALEREL